MSAQPTSPTPGPAGGRSERLLPILAIVLVFGFAVTKVTSFDAWVHLSLGRWMFEQGRIPRTNLLSYTEPQRPTPDHQWLFQACLYGLERTVGITGATLAKACVVAAAFALVVATAGRKGAGPVLACVVVLVAAAAARFRFVLRPEVVGSLFLAAYLYFLEQWRRGRPRGLLWLLPLQVLWANFHGSALLGYALPLAYAAGESARALLACRLRGVAPRPPSRRDLAPLWAVAIALVPLTMLNPNGVHLLTLPFTHAAKQSATGLKELLQDRAAVAWADLGGRHLFFAVLGGVGLASLLGSVARKDVTEIGLFAGLLWAAFHSERFIGVFAVAAAPIVAGNLAAMLAAVRDRKTGESLTQRQQREQRKPRRGAFESCGNPQSAIRNPQSSILAVLLLVLLGVLGVAQTAKEMPLGLGPAPGWFPVEEVAWLQAHHPTGNLFNEFEHGGYVCWRARRPVFIDSRGMLAYAPSFVVAYVEAWTSREAWRQLMERYDVSVALVQRKPLKRMFDTAEGWALVHEGPLCSVYVREAR